MIWKSGNRFSENDHAPHKTSRPCSSLRHMEHDQLVGGAAAARIERAADEIGTVVDYAAAKTVPAMRHRRQRPPAVGLRIVGLILGKRIGRQFAAEHEDQAIIVDA